MKEVNMTVCENIRIAENTYMMKLSFVDNGINVEKPGQFVNIKLDGFFLRRPISVCDWDDESITIIYKTVGKGTKAMSGYGNGKKLSILIPLGNGYDISKAGERPLLIGGGAGVPPMYGLFKTLKKNGAEPEVILGFNTEKEIFLNEEFKKAGARPIITTADGSRGIKGFVTDAMKELSYTYFYACGPEAMLRAVERAADSDIEGQMSFEERMGCGFGACMGCSCETKYGNKRICKDGPVLERSEIIWK